MLHERLRMRKMSLVWNSGVKVEMKMCIHSVQLLSVSYRIPEYTLLIQSDEGSSSTNSNVVTSSDNYFEELTSLHNLIQWIQQDNWSNYAHVISQ